MTLPPKFFRKRHHNTSRGKLLRQSFYWNRKHPICGDIKHTLIICSCLVSPHVQPGAFRRRPSHNKLKLFPRNIFVSVFFFFSLLLLLDLSTCGHAGFVLINFFSFFLLQRHSHIDVNNKVVLCLSFVSGLLETYIQLS